MKTVEQCLAELQRLAAFGAPYGTRVNAEQQYAEAYQQEVREGRKPQLRLKYRRTH